MVKVRKTRAKSKKKAAKKAAKKAVKKKRRVSKKTKSKLAKAAANAPEEAPEKEPPRHSTAEDMALQQREISVAEFFTKNRHLLGFDNPRKALLTTIKEGVDNSLDACEEDHRSQ
jgi:DNA topoisomerase-6 subunit B